MRELALPPALSEWLFYKKFWEELGQMCQKAFDQYEEEVIPCDFTPCAIKLLKTLYSSIDSNANNEERFIYGWDEGKKALHCSINRKELAEWISKLLEFMEHAAEVPSEVYCQL